jgi:hypothetical protein
LIQVKRVEPSGTLPVAHGAGADLEAARLQDLMFDRGDDEGRLVWAQIRRAIEALQAAPPDKPH